MPRPKGTSTNQTSDQFLIQLKFMIEKCMLSYMTKEEIVHALWSWRNVERFMVESVWDRLEHENREFFERYLTKLVLKDQIIQFNVLLEEQARLMLAAYQCGVHPMLHEEPPSMAQCPLLFTNEGTSSTMASYLSREESTMFDIHNSFAQGMMNTTTDMPPESTSMPLSDELQNTLSSSTYGVDFEAPPLMGDPPSSSIQSSELLWQSINENLYDLDRCGRKDN